MLEALYISRVCFFFPPKYFLKHTQHKPPKRHFTLKLKHVFTGGFSTYLHLLSPLMNWAMRWVREDKGSGKNLRGEESEAKIGNQEMRLGPPCPSHGAALLLPNVVSSWGFCMVPQSQGILQDVPPKTPGLPSLLFCQLMNKKEFHCLERGTMLSGPYFTSKIERSIELFLNISEH